MTQKKGLKSSLAELKSTAGFFEQRKEEAKGRIKKYAIDGYHYRTRAVITA